MKLRHLSPLLVLAACTVGGGDSNLDTNRLLNGENGDSAECQECAAAVSECLVSGGDECAEMYFECERICLDPREPDCPTACERELDECYEGDGDRTDPDSPDDESGDESGDDCEVRFEECISTCEPTDPPPEPCQDCEGQLQECLDGAGDDLAARDECWWRFEECTTDCAEPPSGDDCAHCETGFDECIADGGTEQECHDRVEECLLQCRGDEETDPSCTECDAALEQCLIDAGDDPVAHEECWAQHSECCTGAC